jgi:regulatory protein
LVAEFSSRAKKLAPEALYEFAVRALGRRSLTERELRLKLERRALEPAHATEAIERVRGLGYLNDARAAESHAVSRREFDGLGRRRVLQELRRRGVAASTAERAVGEAYAETDEIEQIRQYLERKAGRRLDERLDDPREVVRLSQRLLRAGFSAGNVATALRRAAADPAWLDGLEAAEEG